MLIDVTAASAAVVMLTIGITSSVAWGPVAMTESSRSEESNRSVQEPNAASSASSASAASGSSSACEDPLEVDPGLELGTSADPVMAATTIGHSRLVEFAPKPGFGAARARVEVGAEARRGVISHDIQRFELDPVALQQDVPPPLLVERGIDLTHGRPTVEDDPRVPILDGPERARVLFEAACDREFGKGCHMLGVQIAERMIPDGSGAGPAEHYQRGCDLQYPRSCAALADLIGSDRGQVDAEVRLLEAKACLLAGPSSSYCLPAPASR